MADLQRALEIQRELSRLDEAYTPRRNDEYELRVDLLRQEFAPTLRGLKAQYVHVTQKRKVTVTPAVLGSGDIHILCDGPGECKKYCRILAHGNVDYGPKAMTPILAPIDLEGGAAGGCHYELVAQDETARKPRKARAVKEEEVPIGA